MLAVARRANVALPESVHAPRWAPPPPSPNKCAHALPPGATLETRVISRRPLEPRPRLSLGEGRPVSELAAQLWIASLRCPCASGLPTFCQAATLRRRSG